MKQELKFNKSLFSDDESLEQFKMYEKQSSINTINTNLENFNPNSQ